MTAALWPTRVVSNSKICINIIIGNVLIKGYSSVYDTYQNLRKKGERVEDSGNERGG